MMSAMRSPADNKPLVVGDRALTALLDRAGLRIHLSLEGFPRIRCRLPATWDSGDQCLDCHLFYTIFSGSIAVTTATAELVAGAGDALLLPPRVPFRAHSRNRAVRLARLRFALGKPGRMLAWGRGPRLWRGLMGIEPVLSVAEELLLRQRDDRTEHRAVFTLLHGALQRASTSGALTLAQIDGLRQRVAADPTCTPADLARELGLSHDYATRLIGRSLSRPPRAFILGERLRLAADRLAAGSAPADVATALGWRDPKLFLRQFRAAYGLPPGRWLRHLA